MRTLALICLLVIGTAALAPAFSVADTPKLNNKKKRGKRVSKKPNISTAPPSAGRTPIQTPPPSGGAMPSSSTPPAPGTVAPPK